MRHYEIVFLVHPDQSEEVPAMIKRYSAMVSDGGGQIHRVEDWGRRQLAYMINDVHKAHYAMLNVEISLDTLREIENNFKFNDAIIRNLIVSKKRAITASSPLAREEDKPEEATEAKADSASEASSDTQDKEEAA